MASDTEDLELESLRSAVLASLKTKPAQGDPAKASNLTDSPKVQEDDEEDEDLEALRRAALRSKKEGGSASHISTPVPGSPHHPPQPPEPQPSLQEQPFHQRGTGTRGNLITITLQDLSQPQQSTQPPSASSNQPPRVGKLEEEEVREEKSNKFSRFESSDSESDEDDILLPSDSESSEKSEENSSSEDDGGSWRTRSFSEADGSNASSSSEAESVKSSSGSASDQEENGDKPDNESAKRDDVSTGETNDDKRKESYSRDKESRNSEPEKRTQSKMGQRENERMLDRHRTPNQQDLRTRIKGDNRDRRRERDDPGRRERREEPGRRERRENYHREDREREKGRDERRRDYEARRRERRRSPQQLSRAGSQRSRENVKEGPNLDNATLEARRRKFAPGSSVNIKDKTVVTLKDVKALENGENIPEEKESNLSQTVKSDEATAKTDEKDTPESDSDISLPCEESDTDEEEKKESESESGSDNEMSRFKQTTTSEAKSFDVAPAPSRLITSMTLPKDGSMASLLRRRPNDGDRNRDRWKLPNRDRDRRRQDDRERDSMRRPHLPRHLDGQERSSSRDRSRALEAESRRQDKNDRLMDERDPRRHPRDVKPKDASDGDEHEFRRRPEISGRLERNPVKDADTPELEAVSRRLNKNERLMDVRDPRRHPRDVKPKDASDGDERESRRRPEISGRLERNPVKDIDTRPVRRKVPSAKDFVSESSESESEVANQAMRSIVKTDKPERDTDKLRAREKRERTRDDSIEKETRRKERREKRSKEKKRKHKRDVKDRIGTQYKEHNEEESMTGREALSNEARQVTITEDDAAPKKRSVLDRLGNAPSPEKTRGSVKSRLGPVKKSAPEIPLAANPLPIDPDAEFTSHSRLGPDGDNAKRRNVEISESQPDPLKRRLKLKKRDHNLDASEAETAVEFTVAEPPKRKQLSKSLLSRLSNRPSTPIDPEPVTSPPREGPSSDAEQKERRVRPRDDDDVPSRKKVRKSKIRDVWSSRNKVIDVNLEDDEELLSRRQETRSNVRNVLASKRDAETSDAEKDVEEMPPRKKDRKSRIKDVWSSKRKTVARERVETERHGSKDEDLEERIRKIKAQNAAILQRQREIEEEKKMFGGRR